MANRMTSARFVGRSAQLAELEAALRDAAARRPSLALIAGESGVGKSRLADELVRRAKEQGARVLWGDSVELGEGELPYAPLLGALRGLVRDGDPALDALPAAHRAGLASLMPGLDRGSDAEGATQARVFEGLLALLETLGEDGPVVLVIEDLHWADSSTRHFLYFLARSFCGAGLMVVGTYRSDELHRRHPLRPLLAELSRDPSALMIELPPFTREEMGEQLEGILAAAPDPGLVERLYLRSEGNALFTEEILAAGLDGRGALPPTLRDALMLRVERLSPSAREVLRWLACQPSADHELLVAVVGLEPTALLDALREATASQIAVILPQGAYAFRHALLREVVHDDLLPGERTAMHAALGRALESRIQEGDDGAYTTAQAAHHWQAAGDQAAALTASVRAATAAERVNAFPEAHSLLERALELWERVPEPEKLAGASRIELLERAARAADAAGVPARQEALLRHALMLVDEAGEPRRAAKLLDSLSHSLWNLHRQDEAVDVLDRALTLLPGDEQSSARAKVLATKAKRRMLQARFGEAEDAARESLAIARAVGDRESESRALNALGVSVGGQGDVDAGVEALRQALKIAQDAGFPMEEGSAWINLADLLNLAGNTREAVSVAREGLRSAPPNPHRTADWFRLAVAEFSFNLGDWREAEAHVPSASRRHAGPTLAYWFAVRSMLDLGRGDLEAASADIEGLIRATRGSTEPQFIAPCGIFGAELARRGGDLEQARIEIDRALDQIEFCSDDFIRITALSAAGVRIEGDAGQRARDRRDEEAQRIAASRAETLIERVRLAAGLGGPVEQAERASAEAEYGRAVGAEADWTAAARAWEEVERPYPATYARWREAELLAAGRDREDAETVAAAALETARRLGSDWLAAELESLAARARLRLVDEEELPEGDESDADADPFGLTERERQVLELVAGGATNREIGEQLHMAEKTASVHVSRILTKLEVRSRTEAAAVAHRHGMAPTV
jgi:DNA-binding CsgD family transcriptional regulator/tetratricopeptide (TPR) repeat protein